MGPKPETGEIDPIAFLFGHWRFDRQIEDRLAGQSGSVHGEANFARQGEGLRWTEKGRLELGGRTLHASRRMSVEPDGRNWIVKFEDGRPFHRLELHRESAEVSHPCRDDFYDGRYLVTEGGGGPEFTTEWRVTGPEKDQLIVTRYRRGFPDRPSAGLLDQR